MSQDVHDRLATHGFTPTQAQGLHAAWKSPEMQFLLSDVAYAVHDAGGTAADALDFIKHRLPDSTAGIYHHHGFTAHQAHLIETDQRARENLYGEGDLRALDLLESHAPRSYVTLALTAARDHEQARDLIRRYDRVLAGTPRIIDDVPDTIGSIEGLVAIGGDQDATHCDCAFGPS